MNTDTHPSVPFTREQAENATTFHLREQQAKIDEAKAAAASLALTMIDDLYWTASNADDELTIDKFRQVSTVIHCLEDLDGVEYNHAMHAHVLQLATQAEEGTA